jgi:myo-inositol-1(or 4)-monophosphatase
VSADERIGSESRARMASELALLGGRLALEKFHRAQVSVKRDGTLVTDADVAIQNALGCEIARRFPGDGLVGEEGRTAGSRVGAQYAWIIDPIDGTTNFVRGVPGFAVSIGVLRDGAPFAGAVYDPVARWLFAGCVGRGAWLNDRPLQVRAEPLGDNSVFVIRTPCELGVPDYVEGWMRRYRVRRFGSTALHLCYVALGGLDFVHDDRATVWDIAGAAPILLEAGGMLTTESGTPLFPLTPAQAVGGRIALLAGHVRAHALAVRDVRTSQPAALASAVR